MSAWAETQAAFSAAILNPSLPMPQGLVGPDGLPSLKRFSVYRNNVVVGLMSALEDAYPAVQRIVGKEFFSAMARAFVSISPPKSPMMYDYGEDFPSFIAGFAPAASLPYLADVARIERAWVEAYHAADTTGIDPASLSSLAPEQFGDLVFTLAPSLRIVRSPYRALSIWQMNTELDSVEPLQNLHLGEDALILRPTIDVEVRLMPPGSAAFLETLGMGETVNEALRAAGKETEGFDLSAVLAAMFEAGGFVAWKLQKENGK